MMHYRYSMKICKHFPATFPAVSNYMNFLRRAITRTAKEEPRYMKEAAREHRGPGANPLRQPIGS